MQSLYSTGEDPAMAVLATDMITANLAEDRCGFLKQPQIASLTTT
jgi:hypothetical protein